MNNLLKSVAGSYALNQMSFSVSRFKASVFAFRWLIPINGPDIKG